MPTGKTRKPPTRRPERRTMCEMEAALGSPAWHGDALRKTERRRDTGQEQPVDWAAAKQELRESRGIVSESAAMVGASRAK